MCKRTPARTGIILLFALYKFVHPTYTKNESLKIGAHVQNPKTQFFLLLYPSPDVCLYTPGSMNFLPIFSNLKLRIFIHEMQDFVRMPDFCFFFFVLCSLFAIANYIFCKKWMNVTFSGNERESIRTVTHHTK